jgi:hypothetical protein
MSRSVAGAILQVQVPDMSIHHLSLALTHAPSTVLLLQHFGLASRGPMNSVFITVGLGHDNYRLNYNRLHLQPYQS